MRIVCEAFSNADLASRHDSIVLTSLRHHLTSKLYASMSRHPMKLDD
jgi:hypothetical protein